MVAVHMLEVHFSNLWKSGKNSATLVHNGELLDLHGNFTEDPGCMQDFMIALEEFIALQIPGETQPFVEDYPSIDPDNEIRIAQSGGQIALQCHLLHATLELARHSDRPELGHNAQACNLQVGRWFCQVLHIALRHGRSPRGWLACGCQMPRCYSR